MNSKGEIEMNFTYENQGHITYLSYAISTDDIVDTMSLGMITNNKIHGLAPCIFTQMDTNKFIKYNVSAKISVQQFFAGAVTKKHLLEVFKGIVSAVLTAEDYMIDINSILLNLGYMFVDVSTCEVSLVCLPIQNGVSHEVDLNGFFKNIMFTTQFDQSENCDYVAKIINYLNSSPVFSLDNFKDLLDTLSGVAVKPTVSNNDVTQKESVTLVATPQSVTQPTVQSTVQPVVQSAVPPAAQPTVQPVTPVVPATQPKMATKVAPVTPTVPVAPVVAKQTVADVAAKKKGGLFGIFSSSDKKTTKGEKSIPIPQSGIPTNSVAANGFAIPGQKVPVRNNANGFAIPGQAAPMTPVAPVAQPVAPVSQPKMATKVATPPVAQSVARPVAQPVAQPVAPVIPVAPVAPIVPQQPAYNAPVIPQGQPMNFGETTVLGGGNVGETTVLGASMESAPQVNPHLIRLKNNEKIQLNKPVFRIGKEKSYVDYFIGDNTAISRSHANFITREGKYFVTDTNSTNHTYVNGTMVPSNAETQLSDGDKVRLANEEFEFKLY